jgi:tetratricopeptide (TPR) repeat protein
VKYKTYSFFSIFAVVILLAQASLVTNVFSQVNTNVLQNNQLKNDSDELRQKGFSFLQSGNWQEANSTFEQILAKAPNDYVALYGSGLALFNLRRITKADENIQKAIDFLSKNKSNDKLLADSLVLSAVISATQNKNDAAIEKLLKAVKIAPNNFDANLSLGRAYFGNSDIVNAVKFFRKSAIIQPNNLQARFFLATALERGGNLPEALKEYRAVVKINENYAEGNLGLGVLLINIEGENSVEGLKALQKAISLNGNLYEARITLGKTLVKLDRAKEAVEHLKKAAELAPKNPEPHYQLAIAYRKLGKKTEAANEAQIVKTIHEARRGVSGNQ